MTSSLVGSEMCIRDSVWREGCNVGNSVGWRRSRHFADGSDGTGSFVFNAVSYTHLTLPTICSV
eukprot:9060452-Prorocentrum_lima.AAC.1